MAMQRNAPNRPKPRRSNRETVQWVPVTEAAFARAVLSAEVAEVDLAIWLDEAIGFHLVKTKAELHDRLYAEACDHAADNLDLTPTRREFDRQYRESMTRRPGRAGSMERRGPAGVSSPAPHS